MAGKQAGKEDKRPSMLRNAIYRGDPDELKLQPGQTAKMVPLHGVEEGVESTVHSISFRHRGQWQQAVCTMDAHGACPFCEDPNQEISRTMIRSLMLVYLPKEDKVMYLKLPIRAARTMLSWEDNMNEDPDNKEITVRGHVIAYTRIGSGKGTSYEVTILDDVKGKTDIARIKGEIDRVKQKCIDISTSLTVDQLREVRSVAFFQFRDKTEEADEAPSSVEEEAW